MIHRRGWPLKCVASSVWRMAGRRKVDCAFAAEINSFKDLGDG